MCICISKGYGVEFLREKIFQSYFSDTEKFYPVWYNLPRIFFLAFHIWVIYLVRCLGKLIWEALL